MQRMPGTLGDVSQMAEQGTLVAFFGIGSYVYAFLASPHFGLHWPFPLALAVSVIVTAIFGILILAYLYYRSVGEAQLASIGLLSFAAVAQLLEGPRRIDAGRGVDRATDCVGGEKRAVGVS